LFKVGDLIVYGSTGVCEVLDISRPDDKERKFYVLKPLYQSCIISTPVDTTKVLMRKIISKNEAQQLVDTIPSIQAEAYHSHDVRQLEGHYKAYIKACDCMELLELSMSIYEKKQDAISQKRKLGIVDERYMKRAEELLFGELSAALGIPKNEVPEYISARVDGEGKQENGGSPTLFVSERRKAIS